MLNKYNHRIENNFLILEFVGDLNGEDFGPEVIEVVNTYINHKILLAAVDISNVRYINSSGIGVLITILTKFRNKGGEVVLINPSDHVKKLLIITKLNAIFSILDTLEAARLKFNK